MLEDHGARDVRLERGELSIPAYPVIGLGFIAYLCHTGCLEHDPIIKRHLRRLARHAMPYRGHLGFPGEYLLRLSMDLATGSAGVMLALYTALGKPGVFLPFLDSPVESSREPSGALGGSVLGAEIASQ
jgi:hypothetical protein